MALIIYDYDVFKLSHNMALKTHRLTASFPDEEKFSLAVQMRRSAYSIPTNLIEGSSRSRKKDFARFVEIAAGSCEELRYHYLLARDLGCIPLDVYKEADNSLEDIKKMLTKLKQSLLKRAAKSSS